MRSESRLSRWVLALAVALAGGTLFVHAGGDKNWEAEVGTRVEHTDNFFFRAENPVTPPPAATISTLYASGELELDAGRGKWLLGGQASGSYTSDIPDANYATAQLGVGYKRGRTRASLDYAYLPNRVFSEEADGVFFDLAGLELSVRQILGKGLWAQLEYGVENWKFDADESARDARSDEIVATLRFPLARNAGLRLFGVGMQKDAESPDYDWSGYGYGVALEWTVSSKVGVFARARNRERDYEDAPPTDSNFGRSDSILDALLNLRWTVGKSWGLGLAGKYRNSESTREDRNYDAAEVGISLYYVL